MQCGRVIYILTFYYIIANNYSEDVMLVVIVLLGVFLHSALGGNATLVTQISKSTDILLFILCEFNNLKHFPIMILLNICHIVVLTLSSGEVELFNAEQSSTWCYSDGTCYPASYAIDGDWNTDSYTGWATGTLWLQVSMSNTPVYQIVLRAWSYYSEEITVSLYSGETLAGQCTSHSGSSASNETLSCAKVTADRVRLTLTLSSTSSTYLGVYEITVTEASTNTIGI